MDYKTANGAITHIDESLDYLSQLKSMLGDDLLLTDMNSLDKIKSSVDEIVGELEDARDNIKTVAGEMEKIENTVKGA